MGESSTSARNMDALGHDGAEFAVEHATDDEPVGDAARATGDALTGDARLDIPSVDADLDEPLGEEIGQFAATEVLSGESPEVTHAHFAAVVDADPRAGIELMDVDRHTARSTPIALCLSPTKRRVRGDGRLPKNHTTAT